MSAVSIFMEALEQATHPERPPEPKTGLPGVDNRSDAVEMTQILPPHSAVNSSSLNSTDPMHLTDANAETVVNQETTPDQQQGPTRPESFTEGALPATGFDITSSSIPRPPASGSTTESFTRPRLPVRDSLDDLFSDGESDQPPDSDTSMANHLDDQEAQYPDYDDQEAPYQEYTDTDTNMKDPTWASDGELFSTLASEATDTDPRPYDPHEPSRFYHEMTTAHDLGSPQVSPQTSLHPQPHAGPGAASSTLARPDAGAGSEHEPHSARSEEEQIAQFSDKAFRKALREVEPSLSKSQQHYAWRNAYQEAGDGDVGQGWQEQWDGNPHHRHQVDYAESDQEEDVRSAAETAGEEWDRNPPYQLGMEPVGFMDGVPIFADIDPALAQEEIDRRMEEIRSREQGGLEYQHDRGLTQGASQAAISPKQASSLSSDTTPDLEAMDVRPFNRFSPPGHNRPLATSYASTAPQSDMARREKMLRSSFSQALQALEESNAERMAREGEVDELHLGRLRALSQRRKWAVDEGGDEGDEEQASVERGMDRDRDRDGSPDPPPPPPPTATWTTAILPRPDYPESSPFPPLHHHNHDDSFTTAFESPPKASLLQRQIHESRAAEAGQGYARQHRCSSCEADEDEADERATSHHGKIPGLDQLHHPPRLPSSTTATTAPPPPPRPTSKAESQPQPSTPRGTSHREATQLRKSVEPETPRHLLNVERDCTPAFEDRSVSPSPPLRSRSGLSGREGEEEEGDVEMEMESHPKPSPLKATKGRPSSSRKSAVQGSNVKVEKAAPTPRSNKTKTSKVGRPSSTGTPRSRAASRKLVVSVATAAAEAGIEEGAGAWGEMASKGTRQTKNKVRQAVERIEASVRGSGINEGGKDREMDRGARKKGVGEGTPPTRRSRRLMERRRGETPEVDGDGGREGEGDGDGGLEGEWMDD